MTAKITIQQQIQILQQQIFLLPGNKNEAEKIELEMEIDRIARSLIEAPMASEERREMLTELLRLRARFVQHIPVKGIIDSCLFLNLIQQVPPPSPLCPAYNKMAFPTISTYHQIGSNISCMRLDPKALEYVPKNVLDQVGPLEGKEIDLLWTAIDGRFYSFNRSLNHCTHSWAHRHALPGPEKNPDSNISFDVNMGIFPEVGFEQAHEPGAIAVGHISPMKVHVHAKENLQKINSEDMLYSPDNAHFRAIPGSPLGIDWSVTQKDNRVAITKRVVIFDYDHPICAALIASIRNCDCLDTHLQRLFAASEEVKNTFAPVIDRFKNDHPDAMQHFHRLPLAFQCGVFRETWVSFGSLCGIHGDFGRASFEKDPSLNEQFHCDHRRCAEAIRRFSDRMEHLLVQSQFDLLFQSQTLVKGDNVLTMMKCAQLFCQDPKQGLIAFGNLPDEEQEATRFAFWELNGCPRIANYSTEHFPLKCYDDKALKLKIDAIRLAASRQSHRFEKPLIENSAPNAFEVRSNLPTENLGSSDKSEDSISPLLEELHIEAAGRVDSDVSIADKIQGQLMDLVFDDTFQSLENWIKAEHVNQLFSSLEKTVRERIYGRVYENSRDRNKGGGYWGEKHVADDLEVLIHSFNEGLGN
jgi:hypothetical protein